MVTRFGILTAGRTSRTFQRSVRRRVGSQRMIRAYLKQLSRRACHVYFVFSRCDVRTLRVRALCAARARMHAHAWDVPSAASARARIYNIFLLFDIFCI